ncbi:hypothetical protein [uncultured Paludibaculum sp.]|uniref:hypothetical protein n=1 Tax=uncultured Paludibaculum sp. TaxID=1765020 RepID=UPI002AABB307|nr:hypothetical protein [uncultured Paludibaculum sp.]
MKTIGCTVAVPDLNADERDQMFALLNQHYLGVTREEFARDLLAKDHAILLRSSDGDLVGFSTQARVHLALPDRTVLAVFSGDTIVCEQHRGSLETAREICRYFRRTLTDYPGEELYWVLICKGWRTYRVLRLFFEEYAPKPTGVGGAALWEIANAFGRARYADFYQPSTRLIEFPKQGQRIRPGSAEAIDRRRSDPEMLFFERLNPGHENGTELVCVAPIRLDNFTAAARRLAGY